MSNFYYSPICIRVATGEIKNVNSARVAIPAQLRKNDDDTYIWRTNLDNTAQFWKGKCLAYYASNLIGWFENMSKLFLGCPVAKLLLLANTNRLDTELTIAQMQGKFQMIVLSNVGHTLQADVSHICLAILIFAGSHAHSGSVNDFLDKKRSFQVSQLFNPLLEPTV